MIKIGILALQGDYECHSKKLNQLGVLWHYVRYAHDLTAIDGLILPGGESSVFLRLLIQKKLFTALKNFTHPIFGTCAGAILLAKHVLSPPQISLARIDMTVERNAYGRQLASQIVKGYCYLKPQFPLEMAFIRAPRLQKLNLNKVKLLAKYGEEPVAVQQNHDLASSFHPELTIDNRLHQHFVELVTLSTRKS